MAYLPYAEDSAKGYRQSQPPRYTPTPEFSDPAYYYPNMMTSSLTGRTAGVE